MIKSTSFTPVFIVSLAYIGILGAGIFTSPVKAAADVKPTAPVHATSSPHKSTGLGLILGEPTGLTAKFWLGSREAIDLGLAYSFSDYVLIYSDYLYHFHGAFGSSNEFAKDLTPYVGIGGEIIFASSSGSGVSTRTGNHYFKSSSSSVGVGIRIPFGLEWMTPKVPLGVFIELVPGIGLAPGTYGFLQGGIGARFYF